MDTTFEIIVYDNASDDFSAQAIVDKFPEVLTISSDVNVGFAAANNIASNFASGRWLLLLNPDTKVIDDGINKLLRFAVSKKKLGIYGGASYSVDSQLDYTSCWGRPTLWSLLCRSLGLSIIAKNFKLFNPEELPGWQRDSIKKVPIITGCFLILHRDVWDLLEGFDNDYFMYSEETDLCLRGYNEGIECFFFPEAKIIHVGGASEWSKPQKTIKVLKSKSIYINKHWNVASKRCAAFLMDVLVLSRKTIFTFLSLLSKKYEVQANHWRAVWDGRNIWHMSQNTFKRHITYSIENEGPIIYCKVIDTLDAQDT